MAKYQTKQRRALVSYMMSHPDEQLSVRRIIDDAAEMGISTSSVYRNLSELEAEGKVSRFSANDSHEQQYRYVDIDSCKNALHLSCRICGKTVHMDPVEASIIVGRVALTDDFKIDLNETVIYGVCGKCRRLTEEQKKEEKQ